MIVGIDDKSGTTSNGLGINHRQTIDPDASVPITTKRASTNENDWWDRNAATQSSTTAGGMSYGTRISKIIIIIRYDFVKELNIF